MKYCQAPVVVHVKPGQALAASHEIRLYIRALRWIFFLPPFVARLTCPMVANF